MVKRKGRTFPYFDVDMNSITKNCTTMTIVDRNSIQTAVETQNDEGKTYMKRVFNPNVDEHIVKEITIPAATAKEQKAIVNWMLDIHDDRYTIVYDHRRGSFHVEYAYDNWNEYLNTTYIQEEEEEETEIEYSDPDDLEVEE